MRATMFVYVTDIYHPMFREKLLFPAGWVFVSEQKEYASEGDKFIKCNGQTIAELEAYPELQEGMKKNGIEKLPGGEISFEHDLSQFKAEYFNPSERNIALDCKKYHETALEIMTTHGGKREGAGRRPKFSNTKIATSRIPEDLWDLIPGVKADWIYQAIREKAIREKLIDK